MTIAPSGAPATNLVVHDACGCDTGQCDPPKPLQRNRFFPRKLMEVRHWKAEQAYHRLSRQLVTRLGIGSGVLCGLEVTLTDVGTLVITAGVATDGCGRLVVVPEDLEVDPSRVSGPHVAVHAAPVTDGTVTVAVCYRECGVDPVAIASQSCDDEVRTVPGMIRESYCITVTPGGTERVGLPEGLCEATRNGDLDAEATRALLDRLDPRACSCAEACVPLATVTFTAGSPEVSTSVRTVIRSNRELLDLILCLAERLDECCGHEPPPVVTAPRITALWPVADTDGAALKEFQETHLLEIAFDQDMAEQGLNLPDPWLGVWLLPKPALTHVVQAGRLVVTRSGSPLTHVAATAGGDAAGYRVDLPTLRAGDLVLVMVRSTVAGAIRANGATGLALDADLAATTLTGLQRDALWTVAPGSQTTEPAVAPVPSPPLPSGDGTAGGDLHIVLSPRAGVEVPPRLLAVDPVGGVLTDADWNKFSEQGGFSIVVSRELATEALDSPKNWLRMWYATLGGDVGVAATEVELKLRDTQKLDDKLRYTFAFDGLPKFTDHWQVLWQLRSGPSTDPGAPMGAAPPKLLLDADFAGTALDSQTLFGLWTGAIDSFPFLTPTSTAGQQLWDDTAGGLAHWGLTTRPF